MTGSCFLFRCVFNPCLGKAVSLHGTSSLSGGGRENQSILHPSRLNSVRKRLFHDMDTDFLLTVYRKTSTARICTYILLIPPGYDVIAQAQSGTGKTATFAISILQQIDVERKVTQALVLAPTRELAQQVTAVWQLSFCL